MNKSYDSKAQCLIYPNSEAAAYVLGYLTADGSISIRKIKHGTQGIIEICLSVKDVEIIELIRDLICPSAKIYHYHIGTRHYVNFKHGNKPVVKNILLTYRKTMQHIPDNLKRHFIRGIFDGDGCISRHYNGHKIYLAKITYSNKDKRVMAEVRDYLTARGIITSIYHGHGNCEELTTTNKSNTISLLKLLYANSNFYLSRKKKTAEELIKYVQQLHDYIMSSNGRRTCVSCDKDLPLSDFVKEKRCPSGYRRICSLCYNRRKVGHAH